MHILVIEDEGRIRRRIIRMVEDYFAEQELTLNYCDSLQEGQDYLQLHAIDLLLLDLNLNGQDGFEVLQKMAARAFHVIIISANHDRALQAFEFGVLDFVPKPFGRQRLYQALARLSVRGLGMGSQLKYLSVQKRDTLKLVDVNQIQYIRGAGIYTELILQNGQQEL
ncbi:MAG: response regulator, partial [Bacteroidota bacterium]